ncbi:MAG TPA: hypothetical protein VKB96_14490 [Gammaproteobacteria bacterium]|jgi:hypothetical protein|nr:hypothetical protein [Gammaproteobacteria bacterium]
MAEDVFATITTAELLEMFEIEQPNNEHREKGYALVNVLKPKTFDQERIPGSINIPMGSEDELEQRCAKDKEIIVYAIFWSAVPLPKWRANSCGAAFTALRITRKASMSGENAIMLFTVRAFAVADN